MWQPMQDGSMVQKTPDGWRVRNPNNTYMHVRDKGHTWELANEAMSGATMPTHRMESRVRSDPQAWTPSSDLATVAEQTHTSHVMAGRLLRLLGGTQEKRRGVRGWCGIAITDAS